MDLVKSTNNQEKSKDFLGFKLGFQSKYHKNIANIANLEQI